MTKTQEQCYGIIDRFKLDEVTGKTRDELCKQIEKALVSLNLAYVLADVLDTLMLDCESIIRNLNERKPFGNIDEVKAAIPTAAPLIDKLDLNITEE